MAGKSKYLTLDDIGFVGVQRKKRSASSEGYHRRKTGEIFRKARIAAQKPAARSAAAKAVR